MKPVEVTAATESATPATPARARTSTGGFAKQLTRATSTRSTVQPPDVVATPARTPARGLVGAASRANAAKHAAAPEPAQPQAQLQLPPPTPITAALAALPQPGSLILPTPIATKPAVAPLDRSTARPAAPQATDADSDAPAPRPIAPTTDDVPPPDPSPRTPLEQAVHDLLAELGAAGTHDDQPDDEAEQAAAQTKLAATTEPVAAPRSTAVAPAAPVAPIVQPDAQQLQSAHHAHIVLGDDADRVVMTVAVRGATVNVTLKSADDHTAAVLARNAGALDEAMRHRGLDLDQFEADHEPPQQRDHEHARREPEPTEPFELEENV